MPKIIEYHSQQHTDPVTYIERALASDGDAVPRHIRRRLEAHIAEHRRLQQPPASPAPSGAAFEDITLEQARARALLVSI